MLGLLLCKEAVRAERTGEERRVSWGASQRIELGHLRRRERPLKGLRPLLQASTACRALKARAAAQTKVRCGPHAHLQSEAIRGHQRPSEAIRGHQRSSEVIRGLEPSLGP